MYCYLLEAGYIYFDYYSFSTFAKYRWLRTCSMLYLYYGLKHKVLAMRSLKLSSKGVFLLFSRPFHKSFRLLLSQKYLYIGSSLLAYSHFSTEISEFDFGPLIFKLVEMMSNYVMTFFLFWYFCLKSEILLKNIFNKLFLLILCIY